MGRNFLNLTIEEKKERKRLSNLEYYRTKGREKYRKNHVYKRGAFESKVSDPKSSDDQWLQVRDGKHGVKISIARKRVQIDEITRFIKSHVDAMTACTDLSAEACYEKTIGIN